VAKFKVDFSKNETIAAEREIDFANVEAAGEGAREIAEKLRADGMLLFDFSDWQNEHYECGRQGRRLWRARPRRTNCRKAIDWLFAV
jgi:hypothetical protein